MPKYYVQSKQVKDVLDATNAQQAAILAFQRWCDRQAEAMFDATLEEGQLGNEIVVSETGFDVGDVQRFLTLDILMAWQAGPLETAW